MIQIFLAGRTGRTGRTDQPKVVQEVLADLKTRFALHYVIVTLRHSWIFFCWHFRVFIINLSVAWPSRFHKKTNSGEKISEFWSIFVFLQIHPNQSFVGWHCSLHKSSLRTASGSHCDHLWKWSWHWCNLGVWWPTGVLLFCPSHLWTCLYVINFCSALKEQKPFTVLK